MVGDNDGIFGSCSVVARCSQSVPSTVTHRLLLTFSYSAVVVYFTTDVASWPRSKPGCLWSVGLSEMVIL